MLKLAKIFRGLAVAAALIIYTLLVHFVNSSIDSGDGRIDSLGAVLALIPVSVIVFAFISNMRSRLIGAALLLIFFIVCGLLWPFIKQNTGLMFWLLDVGLMLALLLTFAQSLFKGHKPLCVFFAEIINGGTLPPDHESYARNITIAWVVFFAMIILVSTSLFFMAPITTWSFFVNFLTLPLVALMFIVEYLVRKRLLTDLPESNVMDAVHAYLKKSAQDKLARAESARINKSSHLSKPVNTP